MSLPRNVFANASSQAILAVLGVIAVPLYLFYLGPEAYGLVGFSGVLTIWFQLFDLGLTPAFSRELTHIGVGTVTAATLRGLLGMLEKLFAAVGILLAIAVALIADLIATSWLEVRELSPSTVSASIVLIGLTLPLRWIANLHRATATGLERLDLVSLANVGLGLIRVAGGVLILAFVDRRPTTFFAWQLAASALETAVFWALARRLLPGAHGVAGAAPAAELRRLAPFALNMAFATSVWLIATNADRLLLSKLLSLSDFAWFTLAVTVASFITLVTVPIALSVQPRLARLVGAGDDQAAIALYRKATQLVCVLAAPTSMMAAAFAEPLVRAWTGDAAAAAAAAPVLAFYALGNGVLGVAGLPYQLQYARGQLRLLNIGIVLWLIAHLPVLFFAVTRFGASGAGAVWLLMQSLYLLAWVPLVHRRFAPGLHWRWLGADIVPIVAATGLATWLVFRGTSAVGLPDSRPLLALALIGAGLVPLVVAAATSSLCRSLLRDWIAKA